jgi:hypothetical protein
MRETCNLGKAPRSWRKIEGAGAAPHHTTQHRIPTAHEDMRPSFSVRAREQRRPRLAPASSILSKWHMRQPASPVARPVQQLTRSRNPIASTKSHPRKWTLRVTILFFLASAKPRCQDVGNGVRPLFIDRKLNQLGHLQWSDDCLRSCCQKMRLHHVLVGRRIVTWSSKTQTQPKYAASLCLCRRSEVAPSVHLFLPGPPREGQ